MLDDLRQVQDAEAINAPAAFRERPTKVTSPAAATSMAERTEVRPRPPNARGGAAETGDDEPPRRRNVWPWILAGIFLLALAGGAYALVSARADLAPVPRVLGLSGNEASQKIAAAGFAFQNAGDQPSADAATGEVVRQNPKDGTELAKGKSVSVWLSSGKGTVTVPNAVVAPSDAVVVPRLLGMSRDAAVVLIDGMKLVAKTEGVDSTLASGTVVHQTPAEGQQVAPGSTVIISLSNAPVPTTVTVPAVVGLSPTQATAELAVDSLHARIVSTLSLPRPHGHPKKGG
jgi:beta-lactam-binding protein with PASTA domain